MWRKIKKNIKKIKLSSQKRKQFLEHKSLHLFHLHLKSLALSELLGSFPVSKIVSSAWKVKSGRLCVLLTAVFFLQKSEIAENSFAEVVCQLINKFEGFSKIKYNKV